MGPTLPDLGPGLAVLRREDPTDASLYRLVASELGDADDALWVDARNRASTYALYGAAPSRGALEDLRIARAFTAYQHLRLVRALPKRATPRTDLVVCPRLPSLYRDDDVPADRAERLFEAALSVLRQLPGSLDATVLVTLADGDGLPAGDDAGADGLAARVLELADRELVARETREGVAFDGEDFDQPGYWHAGYWQTTVPYWAEVCGTVPRVPRPASVRDRIAAAHHGTTLGAAAPPADPGDADPAPVAPDGGPV